MRDMTRDLVQQYEAGDWWMIGSDVGSLLSEGVVGQTLPVDLQPKIMSSDNNGGQ